MRAAYFGLCLSIGLCLVGTAVQAYFEKLRLVVRKGIIRKIVWFESKEFSSLGRGEGLLRRTDASVAQYSASRKSSSGEFLSN